MHTPVNSYTRCNNDSLGDGVGSMRGTFLPRTASGDIHFQARRSRKNCQVRNRTVHRKFANLQLINAYGCFITTAALRCDVTVIPLQWAQFVLRGGNEVGACALRAQSRNTGLRRCLRRSSARTDTWSITPMVRTRPACRVRSLCAALDRTARCQAAIAKVAVPSPQ